MISAAPIPLHQLDLIGRIQAIALLAFLGGSAVIGGALLFQHVGGLEPCELCLLERWPYYIGCPVLGVAIFARTRSLLVSIFSIGSLLFLGSVGLALYHVGVEQHWVAGPTACTSTPTAAISIEALRIQLMQTEMVRCDDVQWSLFGISLAGWNAIASLFLTALGLIGLLASWRLGRAEAASQHNSM